MDKYKTILNIANKQTNLGFGLVALLTAAGEQIFSTVVFRCPCNQLNFLYGLVFLLVPALALFILGLILSKKTWKLVTGLCQRKDEVCRSCNRAVSFVKVLFQITSAALVASSSWIAVALLNGNIIECAMTGTNLTLFNNHLCKGMKMEAQCLEDLHTFPCGRDSSVPKDLREEVLLTLRSESQILGWLLIGSIIVFHLLLTCAARCSSPISYLQLKFWRLYTQEENTLMDSHASAHARELAKRNVKSFFEKTSPEDVQTPSNQDWEKISSLYKYRIKDQYYSTLHMFVESEANDGLMKTFSVKSNQSHGPAPSALHFVDDGQVSL